MPFQIIRNDITKVKADAIVNTANPWPVIGDGTDSAIYRAAGADKLFAERTKIGEIRRGDIAVTPAFNLKAKYIIHTVGPIWEGGDCGEFDTLRRCYRKSLEKAYELGCESIAFPLISTGSYGFPKDKALQIAMSEISEFLMRDGVEMNVKLVIFGDKAFRLSKNLFFQVESFITDEEVIEAHLKEYGMRTSRTDFARERSLREREYGRMFRSSFEELKHERIHPHKKPFNEHNFDKEQYMNDGKDNTPFLNQLIRFMNDRDLDNATVYKKSNVTKGAFSKIMCGDTKIPKKKTVLGLCIGLKLTLEEAKDLLASADMAFNPYDKRDKLIVQCILREQYNIDEINMMLYLCKQPLLGS